MQGRSVRGQNRKLASRCLIFLTTATTAMRTSMTMNTVTTATKVTTVRTVRTARTARTAAMTTGHKTPVRRCRRTSTGCLERSEGRPGGASWATFSRSRRSFRWVPFSQLALCTSHFARPDSLTSAAPFARSPGRKPRRPRGSCPRGLPRAVQGHADIVISSRWGEEAFEIKARALGDARRWVFGLDDPGCGRATPARPDSLSLTLFARVFDVLVQEPERL